MLKNPVVGVIIMINRYIDKISDLDNILDYHKEFQHQKQIIRDKADVIKKVQWSDSQLEEYKEFWLRNYGYVPAVEHCKYYESINGVYNYKYIPRALYARVIEPEMNPVWLCNTYSEKCLQEILLHGMQDVHVPKSYVACAYHCYRVNDCFVSREKAVKAIANIGVCLIKPSWFTSSGRNVRVLDLKNGIDQKTGDSVDDIFSAYGAHFIIQELIVPSKELKQLSPNSVNTFRVVTYLLDGDVFCGPVGFRIGVGDSVTDNESSGGYAAGVRDDGTLYAKAFNYERYDSYLQFEKQPDSGILLDGYYVGDVEKVNAIAQKAHSRLPGMGILAWDFTIDDRNQVSFIEVNNRYCGVDLNQVGTGECLFGEQTERILKRFYKVKKITL